MLSVELWLREEGNKCVHSRDLIDEVNALKYTAQYEFMGKHLETGCSL